MNRFFQSTVVVALVSMCAPALAQTLQGTLYKDQDCPCCEGHAKYLMRRGIDVDIKPVEDIAAISKAAGIPAGYHGCHTLILGGYAIEGHVTVEIIHKLLKERPADVVGISLPEMPTGVPGMGGPYMGPYKVYAIRRMAPLASLPINRFYCQINQSDAKRVPCKSRRGPARQSPGWHA